MDRAAATRDAAVITEARVAGHVAGATSTLPSTDHVPTHPNQLHRHCARRRATSWTNSRRAVGAGIPREGHLQADQLGADKLLCEYAAVLVEEY